MGKRIEQVLPKVDIQVANKYITNGSGLLVIRRMQIKTLLDIFTYPLE